MIKQRTVFTVGAFAILGTSLAWGLLGDVAGAHDRDVLAGIQRAEETVAFRGRRIITMGGPEGFSTQRIEVRGWQGLRRVSPVLTPGSFGWMERLSLACCEHAGRMARFRDARRILENYVLIPLGQETIAGRSAERFELRPRYSGRPAYVLVKDAANNFLLRFGVRSPEGETVLDITHEKIEYDPFFSARERPHASQRDTLRQFRRPIVLNELDSCRFETWLPTPPPGFELRASDLIQIKGLFFFEGVLTAYSDGMAWIWVLQFPEQLPIWRALRPQILGEARRVERVARRVACPGRTIMNVTLEGTEVFVAGQLAADEMERVVRTLKRVRGK